jgi:hypothetical protein
MLNMYAFRRLSEVRKITDNWIREYNEKRPHNSLGDLIPREFLMANSNWKNSKIMYLGVDNPIEEIVDASKKYNPELITISISHNFDSITSEKLLIQLREKIDKHISIVTGGKDSPCNIKDVSYIPSFEKYYSFLIEMNQIQESRHIIS